MIEILLLIFITTILLSIVYYSFKLGISPLPSSKKAQLAILSLIPSLHGTLLELGSGWGGLSFQIAKKFPNLNVIGYELSPIPYAFSKLRLLLTPLPNLTFVRKDFLKESFSDGELIVCYLWPGGMKALKEKLPPNTSVISNTFAVPGWTPAKTIVLDDIYKTKVYLYEKH